MTAAPRNTQVYHSNSSSSNQNSMNYHHHSSLTGPKESHPPTLRNRPHHSTLVGTPQDPPEDEDDVDDLTLLKNGSSSRSSGPPDGQEEEEVDAPVSSLPTEGRITPATTNVASSAVTKTPPRHNYAAPHTPIASIKRPRSSLTSQSAALLLTPPGRSPVATLTPRTLTPVSQQQQQQPGGPSSSSMKLAGITTPMSLDDDEEEEEKEEDHHPDHDQRMVMSTPSGPQTRSAKLLPPSGAPRSIAWTPPHLMSLSSHHETLSPMHPIRPVVRHADDGLIVMRMEDDDEEAQAVDELDQEITHPGTICALPLPNPTSASSSSQDVSRAFRLMQTSSATREHHEQADTELSPRGLVLPPPAAAQSWVGRKVDALFSPVLNFLQQQEAAHQQQAAALENSHSSSSSILKTSDASSPPPRSDKLMADVTPPASTSSSASSSESPALPAAGSSLQGDDEDLPAAGAASGLEEEEVRSEHSDELSMSAAEHPEDADDFNPWQFIKSLPPYEAVRQYCPPITLPLKAPDAPPLTLVLDLDETLVHCTVEPVQQPDMTFPVDFHGVTYTVHVRLRPHLHTFLERCRAHFEVIVFTASQKVYANELLNRIDPDSKYIQHRLYRESCLAVEGNFLKDLNVLGRDLSRTILVDNSPHAFGYQVDNGIPIESWFDDPDDRELLKLDRFLRQLVRLQANDVRPVIRQKFQSAQLIAGSEPPRPHVLLM